MREYAGMEMRDFTCSEVADELEVTEATVRRYIRQGLLRAYKRGPLWLVTPESVERLAEIMFDDLDDDESLDERHRATHHCCDHEDEDEETEIEYDDGDDEYYDDEEGYH